jgi:ribokinase
MSHIVVMGSLNMDLVVRTPHMPLPGETVLGRDCQIIPGGKGANQAVGAARLGAQVSLIGRVGADAFGETLCADLQVSGIDTTHVLTDSKAPSGVALITHLSATSDFFDDFISAILERRNFELV